MTGTALLVDDAPFDRHAPPGHHPERPERLFAARAGLEGAPATFERIPARPATETRPARELIGDFQQQMERMLSEAAEEHPVLCVVDDAQWLDQASALTLAFVARRLLAERVGLVFGARGVGEELHGLPDLEVRGLGDAEARAVLNSAVGFLLDEQVRDPLLGQPLATVKSNLQRGLEMLRRKAGSMLKEYVRER